MRPHQDVPNRDVRGEEAPADADDTRPHVAPRTAENRTVARATRRAAAVPWVITPAAIGPILGHHLIEKARKICGGSGGT